MVDDISEAVPGMAEAIGDVMSVAFALSAVATGDCVSPVATWKVCAASFLLSVPGYVCLHGVPLRSHGDLHWQRENCRHGSADFAHSPHS